MARPSVNIQRIDEIMIAYEACIVKYGVFGATLSAIAQEAKLARPLVRHHAGNLSDLRNLALSRFLSRSKEILNGFRPDNCESAEEFVQYLFMEKSDGYVNDTLIATAFMTAALNDRGIRIDIEKWTNSIIEWFEEHLSYHFPKTPPDILHSTSIGLMGITFNADSFSILEPNVNIRKSSEYAALELLKTLSVYHQKTND